MTPHRPPKVLDLDRFQLLQIVHELNLPFHALNTSKDVVFADDVDDREVKRVTTCGECGKWYTVWNSS